MSDILIGASEIEGFQPQGIGADIALTGVIVTLNDTAVTGANFLPQFVVGLGGFKISLGTPAVTYTVASVESRSALTLATEYLASSGTVTGTLHKLVHLRVYVLTPFTPSGESFVAQSGAPGSTAWFRRYGVSIINNGAQDVAHISQITLPATTDSSEPTARYFAGLYTKGGGFIQAFPGCVGDWQLDADTTPTSWAQICDFNIPARPQPDLNPDNFVTESELNARLPSGLQDQMVYFAATGNVLSALTLGSDFDINAGVLELSGPSGINRVQEEGANLPQQQTINFVGSSFTAADEPGNTRTNVSADADLNAIASNATNGIYARTGDGAVAARTITGPAAGITVSNGDGVAGNPTLALANNLAALEAINTTGLIAQTGADTVTPRTITGTANEITSTNGDGVAGNPTLSLPAALTFTGKTVTGGQFNSPRIGTALLDTNGNEVLETPATTSAVNQLRVTNSATGNPVTLSIEGDDANISASFATKGNGDLSLITNNIPRLALSGNTPTAFFGDGITSATPDDFTINGTGGSGNNAVGANLDIAGGKGTGTGVPGLVGLRYPLTTASGTTLQALSIDRFPISSVIYTNTSVGAPVTNTVIETSLFAGVAASLGSTLTLEGGVNRPGTIYRIKLEGQFNTTGTPTIRIRVKIGSTTVVDSTAITAANNSVGSFHLEVYIYVFSIGAAGVLRGEAEGRFYSVATGATTPIFYMSDSNSVIDLTANQTIDATAQWGTAAAGNNATLIGASIERIR